MKFGSEVMLCNLQRGDANRGMFKKRVKVSNIKKPEMFFEEEFWVDTGQAP